MISGNVHLTIISSRLTSTYQTPCEIDFQENEFLSQNFFEISEFDNSSTFAILTYREYVQCTTFPRNTSFNTRNGEGNKTRLAKI